MLSSQRLAYWARYTTEIIYRLWKRKVYQFYYSGPPKYLDVAALKVDIAKKVEALFLEAESKVLPGNIFDSDTRIRAWGVVDEDDEYHDYHDYLTDLCDLLCLNMNRLAEEMPSLDREFDIGFMCYYTEMCRLTCLHAYHTTFGQTSLYDVNIIRTILGYLPPAEIIVLHGEDEEDDEGDDD